MCQLNHSSGGNPGPRRVRYHFGRTRRMRAGSQVRRGLQQSITQLDVPCEAVLYLERDHALTNIGALVSMQAMRGKELHHAKKDHHHTAAPQPSGDLGV